MGIDWRTAFVPTVSLLELALRGSVMYLLVLAALRLFRREAGALTEAPTSPSRTTAADPPLFGDLLHGGPVSRLPRYQVSPDIPGGIMRQRGTAALCSVAWLAACGGGSESRSPEASGERVAHLGKD